jgi:hypothetical protein
MDESTIEIRTLPNQGIYWSAWNATIYSLVFGMPLGLIVGLGVGLVYDPYSGLVCGLASGLVGGCWVGWAAGADACLNHLVLRLWLVYNGSAPWNYVRFLDHAAERILLRKVGGGYAFIHRMLLDYFAGRNVEPSHAEITAAKPFRIELEV